MTDAPKLDEPMTILLSCKTLSTRHIAIKVVGNTTATASPLPERYPFLKRKDFALLVMTFFLPTTLTSSSTKSILTSPLYNVCKKRFNHYAFNYTLFLIFWLIGRL